MKYADLPPIDNALESCKTDAQIDAYFDARSEYATLADRIERMSRYMGIISTHYVGDGGNDELTYRLLKESFCDGHWRLICGRDPATVNVQTNGDIIRAMSDDRLALLLEWFWDANYEELEAIKTVAACTFENQGNVTEIIKRWLGEAHES